MKEDESSVQLVLGCCPDLLFVMTTDPLAGLWEGWKDANGRWVKTCTILTTIPNAVTSTIHDRMPVILDPADYDVWLDPGMKDSTGVSELLRPFDASGMRCYPVSSRVNNVQNDDAECARPATLDEPAQQPLFSS